MITLPIYTSPCERMYVISLSLTHSVSLTLSLSLILSYPPSPV